MAIDVRKAVESHNIAEDLDEDKLKDIAEFVSEGYKADVESRKDWEANVDKWTNLALQTHEQKNFPWPKAANVKYPLLSTAAMQFAARAYPALVPSDGNVVNARIVGKDEDGAKATKAEHISKHMSWQLLYEMDDWEEEMDKLLVILPVIGTVFKKTYFDATKGVNVSKLILPKDLVVNYWAKSLEEAERKTEVLMLSKRVIKERQLDGVYCDVELGDPPTPEKSEPTAQGHRAPSINDDTTPYRLLEQHTFYDLDDDGYPEPYIITIDERGKQVLRIVARYEEKDIKQDEKGKIIRITPTEYYTKFPFIPNPDGSFYDIGFGLLLGSINDTINTGINQTLDSGTLKNLPSGFISKNLRLRQGEQKIGPGEWRSVNATGQQMKDGIVPLPVNEPSKTTFELVTFLVEAGDKLASIAEIFVGKMPGQNTPATTTMASVDQGMKLFTAVYKRIFRALEKEYKKVFRLNSIYLDEHKAQIVLDDAITKADYDETTYDVCPGADPTAFSSTQKLVKAQALMELLPLGTIDPIETTKRILDGQEQPNWQALVLQQPRPDPKMQEMQMKMQIEQQSAQMDMQLKQMEMQFKERESALKLQMEKQMNQMEIQFKQMEMAMDAKAHQMDMNAKVQESQMKMHAQTQQHQMDMTQAKEQHSQDMKLTKEQGSMKKQQMKEQMALKKQKESSSKK
jgi:chaperonin GroES